jgi:quercetin dioxygenase-like cupin family protein
MEVHDWENVPIDWLSDRIGRQVIHMESMTFARVTLRQGAVVPMHEHENEQIATVTEGRLRFVVGDEEHIVEACSTVPLAANVPHEVEALVDSIVVDVFSPVREDWLRGDDAYLRR